jgi:putative (di)nucleoside polyphosphate hydrolase
MSNDWIDAEGFRANVGIILANSDNKLMLGGRVGAKGWQFPQGGMLEGEEPVDAMFRELREEVGLEKTDVEVLDCTSDWLRYKLPDKFIRRHSLPLCIGQKQRWFMLRLTADPNAVRFDRCDQPEFDRIRWVDYWRPVNEVIYFKRRVYVRALRELGSSVHPDGLPAQPRWWPNRWRAVFDKDRDAAADESA